MENPWLNRVSAAMTEKSSPAIARIVLLPRNEGGNINIHALNTCIKSKELLAVQFPTCAWITTSLEQQCSQTVTNGYFAFSIFICNWASFSNQPSNPYISRGCIQNHSLKWPALVTDTFFHLFTNYHHLITRVSKIKRLSLCGFALWFSVSCP